ncbi:MAG: nitroreductase [Dehalococcoidia bacterium]|jgi:nitroreductase|nr:MAG: nitroreductase [Dehalococcoidia bacterium]
MEVFEAIRTRRSIRRFKTTPVSDEILNKVLEATRLAPSWANTQCWRFIVVRDAKVKAELATALIGRPVEGSTEIRPNGASEAFIQAPVIIVACAELGRSGYFRGEPSTDKGDWYMFDTALAMENLVLAATSLGLGTVFLGLFDAPKAARLLDVPEGFAVVAMTPLGYPDQEPQPRPRRELSETVFYDHFGNSLESI